MKLRYLVPIFGIILAALLAVIAVAVWWTVFPNRVIVRNSSDGEVTAVELVCFHQGRPHLEAEIARLLPGEAVTIRHRMDSFRAKLTYTVEGGSGEPEQANTSVWTGDGLLLDIQPDGTLSIEAWHSVWAEWR